MPEASDVEDAPEELIEADDPRKPRLPEDLTVKEKIVSRSQLKPVQRHDTASGMDVSEALDSEPARFFRRLTIRPKYVKDRRT